MYTIGQVAEITGISAHTLRFYDKEGLFPSLSRDGKKARLFSDQDLEWVRVIQCFRDTGMPLAEIKEYWRLCQVGDSTLHMRHQLIVDQLEKAEQERLEMDKRIATLRGKVEWYNGLVASHEGATKRD